MTPKILGILRKENSPFINPQNSKASSPTNRTEREGIEEAGQTLMQALMNQSQPKQSASETPTSSKYIPIDNSPKTNFNAVNTTKTRSDSNRISPRPGQARQIQPQKVPAPALGTKIQNSGSYSSSQKRTPRLSPRDNILGKQTFKEFFIE